MCNKRTISYLNCKENEYLIRSLKIDDGRLSEMGYMGKILRVDLEKRSVSDEPLNREWARDFIGGRGLGMRYLFDEVDPMCDPLGPENKLIMMTGPLTGTSAPTGARYMVMTKSPLTGAVTCSNSGGHFPAMLKKTGIDGIIFEGCAEEPVYLYVTEKGAELRSATHLWGKDTHQTTDFLKRRDGQAGEGRLYRSRR
jgi:aldehyde:ferredoxin oxidoreductase